LQLVEAALKHVEDNLADI